MSPNRPYAKVVSHGSYVAFQMAEVAIPRNWSPTSCGWSPNYDHRPLHHSVRRSIVMRSMESAGKVRLDYGKHNIFRSSARRRPPRRPSTRCCGNSRLPGTPVRDNISLKWAAMWGMPLKLGVSLVTERC
jgi:hypothetical protein